MKLETFIKKNRYKITHFAQILGISRMGLVNILRQKNKNILLSTAYAIDIATKGEVSISDLLPTEIINDIEKNVAEKLEWNDIK